MSKSWADIVEEEEAAGLWTPPVSHEDGNDGNDDGEG